jgi:hypothetical protein
MRRRLAAVIFLVVAVPVSLLAAQAAGFRADGDRLWSPGPNWLAGIAWGVGIGLAVGGIAYVGSGGVAANRKVLAGLVLLATLGLFLVVGVFATSRQGEPIFGPGDELCSPDGCPIY